MLMDSDTEKVGCDSCASSSSEASTGSGKPVYCPDRSESPQTPDVFELQPPRGVWLRPLAKIHVASEAVISVKIPTIESQKPRIAIVFADNTVRVFVAETLEMVGSVISLQTEAPVTAITAIDSNTIVTGGSDGHLIVSDVLTGRISKKIKAHDEAVIAVDSCLGYVVSVGRDKKIYLTCFSFGRKLKSTSNLIEMPSGVKFCFKEGTTLVVAVVCPARIWFCTIGELDFISDGDIHELNSGRLSERQFLEKYKLVDVVFNDARTHYAAAMDGASNLRIITGNLLSPYWFRDIYETGQCVLSTGKNVYSKSKLALSCVGTALWVADNDGAVSYVRVADEHTVVSDYVDLGTAVSCLQVCCINDQSYLLITGEESGDITVWK